MLGADHIAMAIAEHCWQMCALVALGNQKRAAVWVWVGVDGAAIARRLQAGLHGLFQIGLQMRRGSRVLAFGGVAHQICKLGFKLAAVEIAGHCGQGCGAAHAGAPATASPQGDMISVQPEFSAPRRITPAGQAKA